MTSVKALCSIIVPVYNTEKYLEECLLSLQQQTYTNIEIICVNDGSTDGSLNILRKKSKEDSRIIVIDSKHNGVAHTKNLGLINAKGEYITYVDSDDYVADNYCATLIETILSNKTDGVSYKFVFCQKSSGEWEEKRLVNMNAYTINKNTFCGVGG